MRVPDRLIALFLFLVSMAVYLPSTSGEFVFDDRTQIQGNQLIQRPEFFTKALRCDVFAFRSESHLGGGVYWRPAFVAWLIANYAFFGIEPFGWHLTSLLVYGVVNVLAFLLVRRVGGSQIFAACAVLLFAVHPVHVEAVAWISGVTEPLLTMFCFASLLLLFRLREKPTPGRWAAALGVYALALLTKEPAVFFPVLVLSAVRHRWGSAAEGQEKWRTAFRFSLPYAGLAVTYLICRSVALGGPSLYYAGMSPFSAAARNFLTAPSAILFYLREALVPIWVAPTHPFRAVTAASAGWSNFVMPMAALLFVGLILEKVLARNRVANFGIGLFLLGLAAALNVAGLGVENAVHDRYLFMPLLGVMLVSFCLVETALRRLARAREAIVRRGMLTLATVLAFALGVLTVQGQDTWSSDKNLWDAAAASDPGAAWVLVERSALYLRQGRPDEAQRDAELAYRLLPFSPEVILQRADVAIEQARYADALGDLRFFLERIPASADARTKLGVALQRLGQYDSAIALFRDSRARIPARYCSFTHNMAVVMAQSGNTEEAIRELEAVRPRLGTDENPASRLGLKFLGFLYRQTGRTADARNAEMEFLRTSEGMAMPAILAARAQLSGLL